MSQRKGRYPWWVLPLLFVEPVAAIEWGPYLESDTLAYSETVELGELMGEWGGESRHGDSALLLHRTEVGVAVENWHFGLLHRFDYHLSFTPQTAAFYHRQQNKLPNDPSKIYQLDLEGFHFQASGLTASLQIPISEEIQLGLRGEYLLAQELRTIQLHASGTLAELDKWTDIKDLRFHENYRHNDGLLNRLSIPERSSADGRGGTFGLELDWKRGNWQAQLAVDDLWGKIYWDRAVVTTLQMKSGTHGTWSPVFPDNGREMAVTQELPRQIRSRVGYQLTGQWGVSGRWRKTRNDDFIHWGLDWIPGNGWRTAVELEPNAKALGITLETERGLLSIASDTVRLDEARFLSVQARVGILF